MTRASWFAAIFSVVVWSTITVNLDPIASRLIPHSWWYDLRAAQVRSVTNGGSPLVIFDRNIARDIDGVRIRSVLYPVAGEDYRACERVRALRPKTKGEAFASQGSVTLAEIQDSPPNPPCIFEDGGDYRVDFTPEAKNVFWWLPGVTLSYTVPSNIFNWRDDTPDREHD